MLERFKVPEQDQVRVSDVALRKTVADLFVAVGVAPEAAAEGADVLVATDLRGVETHGVSNMLRAYLNWYRAGTLNPRPTVRVLREFPGTATLDGDGGLGIMQGRAAMQLAIDKARAVGVGVVVMRNSSHLGAVGHFARLAASADMVGVCITAGGLLVLPTWGAAPRLGTNPISIAAPAQTEPWLLFDAATSTVAGNKLGLAERVGALMEPGWIAEPDGTPIMQPRPVPAERAWALLPLGGTRESGSHKGYGFGLLAETLTGLLAGVLPSMLDNSYVKHHFAAYNIAAFCDVDEFKAHMDATLRALRETPPAPGHERVLYPGLPEHEEEQRRLEQGIPLHREVIDWFDATTEELGLPALERLTL
jgi:LDH2 family malate/lactate/ureidoglycolate dehydrogenase